MRQKNTTRNNYAIASVVASFLLCIGLGYVLYTKVPGLLTSFGRTSSAVLLVVVISAIFSAVLLIHLLNCVKSFQKNGFVVSEEFNQLTQKVHSFRGIVEILMDSELWPKGLREYFDKRFPNLSYFDVKEFYKGNSKQAIEFLQERHKFYDTEDLYLELKSLLVTNTKEKYIPETLKYPDAYDAKIVSKWVKHKSGSGLWYYFGFKYGTFKDVLNLDAVYERQQVKILSLATSIETEAFEDASFNSEFFAKLGQYMSEEILPKLFQLYDKNSSNVPQTVQGAYILFGLLTVFGILLPVLFLLLNLHILTFVASTAIVVSSLFFMTLTGYLFLDQHS